MKTAANTNQPIKLNVPGRTVMSMAEFSGRVPYAAMPDQALAAEMQRYVEHGVRPSGFLYALLTNDIGAAVALAPAQRIGAWMEWVMDVPLVLQGSAFAVEQWIGWHADPASYVPLPFTISLPFAGMVTALLAA